MISRLCEEFSCLPSAAREEWLNAEVGWIESILEARAYARAKADNAADPKGWGQSRMRTLAFQIEAGLAQEDLDRNG